MKKWEKNRRYNMASWRYNIYLQVSGLMVHTALQQMSEFWSKNVKINSVIPCSKAIHRLLHENNHYHRMPSVLCRYLLYFYLGELKVKAEKKKLSEIINYIEAVDWGWGLNRGILIELFLCIWMDRAGGEVHRNANKVQDQYPPIRTKQDWLIKILFWWQKIYIWKGGRVIFVHLYG
jgi:hypothetical protein